MFQSTEKTGETWISGTTINFYENSIQSNVFFTAEHIKEPKKSFCTKKF